MPRSGTLRDVIDRAITLEMAYNPNDCVELRWGAPAKSDEASTCKRYAPAAQREKMSKYRACNGSAPPVCLGCPADARSPESVSKFR
jgi:hypothetical protein